jgi:sarcosine oxidase
VTAPRYDVIVAGVGSMGSAALHQLARRGCRVLGLERFEVAHDRGSMHGRTRIIRLASHERPEYVPLLQRAYELWTELDPTLLHIVGLLDVGREDCELIQGALLACRANGLRHELLDAEAMRARYPQHLAPTGHVGLLQPDGGYLESERGVRAHVEAALAAGAELRTGERVLEWSTSADAVEVRTERGRYAAGRLVLAPGAWAAGLLHLPESLFAPERQVIAWFEAPAHGGSPVLIAEEDGAEYYGIVEDGRLKLGLLHHPGDAVDPDTVDRRARADEAAILDAFATRRFRGVGRQVETQVCLFTNTPDGDFVLDLHPEAENVVVASVCSGHGYKFAPVVGEILADLALDGETRHSIDFLRLGRLVPG